MKISVPGWATSLCVVTQEAPPAIKAVEATVDRMPELEDSSCSLKTLCVLTVGHGGQGGD